MNLVNLNCISGLTASLSQVDLKTWHNRAVTQLNTWDTVLDQFCPNFWIQTKADELGAFVVDLFKPLKPFNEWLEKNGQSNWYQEFALYLAKLPMKVARNVALSLYIVIKNIVNLGVHPLKELNHLARALVDAGFGLFDSKNWYKLGGSLMGAAVGQGMALGVPYSPIQFALGAAFTAAGLAKSADFKKELTDLPVHFGTGAACSYLVGRVVKRCKTVTDEKQARIFADKFVKENNLPDYTDVQLNNGKIQINLEVPQDIAFIWDKQGELIYYTDLQHAEHAVQCNPGSFSTVDKLFYDVQVTLSSTGPKVNAMTIPVKLGSDTFYLEPGDLPFNTDFAGPTYPTFQSLHTTASTVALSPYAAPQK